ncbi:MAG: DUF4142 domain-containing protein [Janthinobacterium lividum]
MKVQTLAFASTLMVALTLPFAAFGAEPASAVDKVFVGNVSQGGAYEVEASKYAALHATMPDVKNLAIAEVHDHEGVGANLKKIAAATGIPVAPTLNEEFQQRLAKLKAVSASAFDAAYIADMKSIHDKDEKLFAKEANEGSSNFKTFAHQTDLIVKRHIGALNGY